MNQQPSQNYSIHHFTAPEWPVYKGLRLEALQTAPGSFGSTYDKEAQRTDDEWEQLISNPRAASFGLYHGDELVGITGIFGLREEPMHARLVASFIREAHRRKGLSALLYEARIQWARDRRFEKLLVSHRAGNLASKAANQRFGFQYTHTEPCEWPDGQTEDHVFYELNL